MTATGIDQLTDQGHRLGLDARTTSTRGVGVSVLLLGGQRRGDGQGFVVGCGEADGLV